MTAAIRLQTPDGSSADVTGLLATRPAFIIGSDDRADLRLIAPGVQPAHAVITLRGGQHHIAPRFPTAEVRVNGKPVRFPMPIRPGDLLHIARNALTVQVGGAALPVTVSAPSPARLPGHYPALALAAAAPASLSAPPRPHEIYFPQPAAAAGSRIPAYLAALVTLVAVTFLVGFGIVNSAPTRTADIASRFAFNDDHVTVVMFETSWCQFCKAQKPILTDLAGDYRGKVYNQFLDAEAAANADMVAAFNVSSYPVTVIFNDQGQVTARFLGLTDARIIRLAIDQALSESAG